MSHPRRKGLSGAVRMVGVGPGVGSEMSNNLDRLLRDLSEQPIDRDLVMLEIDVQQRIGRRARPWLSFAPMRMAMVSAAMVMGIGIGGFTAASAVAEPRPSLFAATYALAPSTLLDGGR